MVQLHSAEAPDLNSRPGLHTLNHVHARTHARTHTRTRTHARTHARKRSRTQGVLAAHRHVLGVVAVAGAGGLAEAALLLQVGLVASAPHVVKVDGAGALAEARAAQRQCGRVRPAQGATYHRRGVFVKVIVTDRAPARGCACTA